MAQHKVGFTGGINKDLAKDKYDNKHYFDANNIKVVTDAGMSTGSIENERGNSLLFRFPTVGARYKVSTGVAGTVIIGGHSVSIGATTTLSGIYDALLANSSIATLVTNNSVYIFHNDSGVFIQVVDTAFAVTGTLPTVFSAAVTTVYVAGWCRLNEWIIVFTTDTETTEPASALCQIWKFKFTSGSRTTIDSASGTLLVASSHLLYNEYLNYSTATYIRDTVANYETDEKGRVYWTDYFNQVRVANVFDTSLMGTKPNDLGLIAEVTLSQPIIQTITNVSNGLPSGAHYQYFYKLLDTDGRETIFSPGSQLIDVQKELSNDTGVDYFDLDSSLSGTADNKSFEIGINDIDTDFDILELYVVIWETLDSPAIYKVDDYNVSGPSMTFTHNSLDNNINIPVTEFMEIGIPFTAKTLEDRDKVLTAGNIKESKFDLTYDARAWRYNAAQDFVIFDDNGTTAEILSVAYSGDVSTIPETHDGLNPTNDDTNSLGSYNYDSGAAKQIYKADGSTIGGEGTNVSYKFYTQELTGSTGSRALKDDSPSDEGYNTCDIRTSNTVYGLSATNLDGTTLTYNIDDEFNNAKSAKLNAILTGYARGEVYRFGVVFYSKSGQRSYVKWIGDIKMPDPSLGTAYKVSDSTGNTSDQENVPDHQSQGAINTNTYNLGVEFTVDVTSIKSQISGFEIVRVKRTASDRTRLGTGMVTNYVNYGTGDGTSTSVGTGNNARTILRKYAELTSNFYTGSNGTKTNWSNSDNAIDCSLKVGTTVYGDSETNDGTYEYGNLLLADHPSLLAATNLGTGSLLTTNKILLNFTAPCADFSSQSDFSINTTTDFIRDYGYYSCKEYIYNDDNINDEQSDNNLKKGVTGYIYRAKAFSAASTHQNYRIATERYLTDGEFMYSDGSDADDTALLGTIPTPLVGSTIQGVGNTSYTFYENNNHTPFGLGTAKQFIRLGETTTGHITTGASLDFKAVASPDTTWQNVVHYFKEVAYCRELTNQYGGNTFEARSKNLYISTGSFQIINDASGNSHTMNVFGGDNYVVSYARQYTRMFLDNSATVVPYPTPVDTKMGIGFVFCAESPVNTAWRTGEHWGGESADTLNNYFRGSIAASLPKGDQSIPETFNLDNRHEQSNNIRTDFLAKDYLLPDTFKFPNRIKVSRTKIDNELTDSWRSFPANQFDDVDGSMGQIHKLVAFKDQLIYFQDRGVGILPINERAVIEDVTGAELVLGDGQLIGKYKYLTETSGTKHQHSVIVSDKAVYYYDSLQQKLYMLQNESLTESLGLHSMFHGDIKEILRDSDELYVDSPVGVHGVYDKKNERVLYTFLGGNTIITAAAGYYSVGDIILSGTTYLRCLIQGDYLLADIISSTQFEVLTNYEPGITIGFNEKLQAFESFYDFRPGNYLNFDDKLLSIDPIARVSGYVHEETTYGSFYGKTFNSDITLVVMPSPDIIAIFNNIEYLSEVTLNKKDIVGETLTSLQAYNEYQNTGKITLSVGTIAKRRMRVWRHKLKRDVITTNNLNSLSNPKLRNYYIFLKLTYNNNLDKRLVLSDVVISYTPTRM